MVCKTIIPRFKSGRHLHSKSTTTALTLGLIFALGCSSSATPAEPSGQPVAPSPLPAAAVPASTAAQGSCDGVAPSASVERPKAPDAGQATYQPKELIGLSRAAICQRFGPPPETQRFTMGEGVTEFRITLLNTYKLPASAKVEIVEDQWSYGGFRMALWFHQVGGAWVVLDGIVWADGVEF